MDTEKLKRVLQLMQIHMSDVTAELETKDAKAALDLFTQLKKLAKEGEDVCWEELWPMKTSTTRR